MRARQTGRQTTSARVRQRVDGRERPENGGGRTERYYYKAERQRNRLRDRKRQRDLDTNRGSPREPDTDRMNLSRNEENPESTSPCSNEKTMESLAKGPCKIYARAVQTYSSSPSCFQAAAPTAQSNLRQA